MTELSYLFATAHIEAIESSKKKRQREKLYLYLSFIPSCYIRDCPTSFFLDAFFVILYEKLIEMRKHLVVNYKLKNIPGVTLQLLKERKKQLHNNFLSLYNHNNRVLKY